jgi:hypothetical protein
MTQFLSISFSAKINNKSALKKTSHISFEEKLNIFSLDQLGIKKTPRLLWFVFETTPLPMLISAIKGMWVMDMPSSISSPWPTPCIGGSRM